VVAHPHSPDWLRWGLVEFFRYDCGKTWGESYAEASKLLTRSGFKAKPETVKKAYERIERSLPPDQRRPRRTYRQQAAHVAVVRRRSQARAAARANRKCEVCGQRLKAQRSTMRFCSARCRVAAHPNANG